MDCWPDNAAVVIGGMVVATLLGPILGIALAMVEGEARGSHNSAAEIRERTLAGLKAARALGRNGVGPSQNGRTPARKFDRRRSVPEEKK
jgi:hypothetical protein